jgi:hypothetical protein
MVASSGPPVHPGSDVPVESEARLPGSVAYARGLLWLQAGIWTWLAVSSTAAIVVVVSEVLAGHRTWDSATKVLGLLPVAAVLAGVLAVTKIRLARRLRARRDRIRKTVIGIEFAMALLGALMTVSADFAGGMPADSVTLAALVGGGLSLAAAVRLLRRPAREYFVQSGPFVVRARDSGDDHAVFSRLVPLARTHAPPALVAG